MENAKTASGKRSRVFPLITTTIKSPPQQSILQYNKYISNLHLQPNDRGICFPHKWQSFYWNTKRLCRGGKRLSIVTICPEGNSCLDDHRFPFNNRASLDSIYQDNQYWKWKMTKHSVVSINSVSTHQHNNQISATTTTSPNLRPQPKDRGIGLAHNCGTPDCRCFIFQGQWQNRSGYFS